MKFIGKVQNLTQTAADKAKEVRDTGSDQVQSILADFNAARPHLRQAGFQLLSMQIQLGIPPKLVPQYSFKSTDDASVEDAKAALKDNRIGMAILGALLKASAIEKNVRMPDLQFSSLEVELSVIPTVSLNYERYSE